MPTKKKKTQKKASLKPKNKKLDTLRESQPEVLLEEKPKTTFRFSVFRILILIVVFFVLGSLLYRNKGLLIAGTVNNKPILSFELYKRLVNQFGKQMLDQIIVEKIIFQEAVKRKINIPQEDIDKEIKKIEERLGGTTSLNEALSQQGMTMKAFREQIKLRLIATKLVEDKVNVSDEEVDKYLNENKESLPKEEDQAKQKEQIKNFLREQKLSEEIQKLITELKKTAKISTFL